MKRFANPLAAAVMALSIGTPALASEKASHWGYQGHEGPEHWGELSPKYATCARGSNQSPVNLVGMVEGELPGLKVAYAPGGTEVLNNGHTIQVNVAPGDAFSVRGHRFELKQFHFHSPSENTIEGRSYPMEAHFVHADADGNLAVIAVMFEEGPANAELAKAWALMPEHAGEKAQLAQPIAISALLPSDLDYYRFNGSLTTPPCSEGVRWYVMKRPMTLSAEQLEKFRHVMHHDNNRPVQPLNARIVVQ